MSTTYRTGMRGLAATPEGRELAARIDAENAEARERFDDRDFRAEKAAEFTEIMFEGFQHENLLELMTTVRTVEEGDRIFVSEVRGLRVHWVSNGGTIDQSVLKKETWELVEDTCGWHLSEDSDKLKAGWVTAQNELVDLAIKQLDGELNSYLLRLWQAAIPFGHASFSQGAGISLPLLDAAITGVQEETLDEEPAIVGRASVINQIHTAVLNLGAFLPETNEQLVRLGVLGSYKGCRIIKLRNYRDSNNVSFFPRNELYVLGRDASIMGFWGGMKTREWMDPNGGDDWHLRSSRKVGAAVARPERGRRIKDTSLAA